ncbi:gamma-glutamyltransferase family protein [Amorphus orientalis]|uniref:Gamma-glutamyltranspeptidase/glutathione hydrolase n=1 Tax=Amorphus orientalis TaxID=649198 RepID=A0AAE3VLS3_9HYPH|nr:gamma-glutamyltransferase family protein [Amorphus orientalis]MDQ0314479.1 gamma-glutamyltranspeptidase/glutathione hydrolase [Amorphus orientalis]
MLNTPRAYRGMTTAPHHLASRAGLRILEEGGNAAEAMLVMAATIAVVYPHMNAIGGDGFWIAHAPGSAPVGIQACGPAAGLATPDHYADLGFSDAIPGRGGPAALTVAGTIGGWQEALGLAAEWGGRMPLSDLLSDAILYAREGAAICSSQARLTAQKLGELKDVSGFSAAFLDGDDAPDEGARQTFPALAGTLERLADAGLDDFYRGDVARALAADLEAAGSPVRLSDLEAYRAQRVAPLYLAIDGARLFNMPPPTQGAASLAILGILDRLGRRDTSGAGFVHDAVEATKQAFLMRDAHVFDPAYMSVTPESLLEDRAIARMAAAVDRETAAPWPQPAQPGDTIWMGAIDGEGRAVSFIQSIYWEFGSGVVSPQTGVLWQNRGMSFSLDPVHPNVLAPGRLPFHTLNPAMALFDDGRTMAYGTMGGEGQPQTQAAIFARYVWGGAGLQQAVTAPRWLLGRTWGAGATNLKLESRFEPEVVEALRAAGHDIEIVDAFSDMMGHAGALVRHADGLLEGASDPRADGAVAAF